MATKKYLDGDGVAQVWQATKDYADQPDHITDAMLAQTGGVLEKVGNVVPVDTDINLGSAAVGTYKGEVGETIVEGTSASYRKYAGVNVTEGEQYTVKVWQLVTSTYPHMAWAVNDSNVVIAAYGQVVEEIGEYEYSFTIPANATKLLVMTNYRANNNIYVPTLIRHDIQSLQEQVNDLRAVADRYVDEVYVSPDGLDINTGTFSHPLRTIAAALTSGKETIYVKAGTYDETITASNRSVTIRPYDGDEVILHTSSAVNYCVNLTGCVVDIEGVTVIGASDYTDAEPTYKVTKNCFYIVMSSGTLRRCKAVGSRTAGMRFDGSVINVIDGTAIYNGSDGFNAHDYVDSSDNNAIYTSALTLTNCVADHNGDDGASVHEYGGLIVYGGSYTNNATGGVTPFGQCRAEVHGAYITGNKYGIDAIQTADATYPDGESGILSTIPTTLSVGNRIEGNTSYAMRVASYNIFSIGDMLRDNAADESASGGTITWE